MNPNNSNYSDMWGSGNQNLANYGSSLGSANSNTPSASNNWGSEAGNMASGLGSLFSGLSGSSSSPYAAAMAQYQQFANQGANAMMPYMNMGTNAMPAYQNWAQSMSNPSQFENNMMNQYQESPNAKYMQQQAIRSAMNAGAANGLGGSTPMMQQIQQNAGNISQQDMQNWMGNAMGINQMYGSALSNQIGMGEMGSNSLLGLYGNEASAMGNAAYGQQAGKNQNKSNIWGSLGGIVGGIGGGIFGGPGGAAAGYAAGSKL
jgi:hypothetical protein